MCEKLNFYNDCFRNKTTTASEGKKKVVGSLGAVRPLIQVRRVQITLFYFQMLAAMH